ncbi:uncharacterized protein CG4449 [Leptopilina boulardi]|uniref:uncharacterized protein CG4449 n=1 Tax=Leptopilina boulardi TaxID=63433 RepID=UPI0021F581A0|nr:uncharacterized protein CG4449 [Leptopilina boulardi]
MIEVSDESLESSDEDIYTNAVARFKAAKKKERFKSRKIENDLQNTDDVPPIEIAPDEGTTNTKETEQPNLLIFDKIEVDDDSNSDSNSLISETNDSDLEITGVTRDVSMTQTDCIVVNNDENEISIGADLSRTDSIDNENYKTEVKVLWRSHKLVHLEMDMHEPFQNAFQHFEKLENVPIERILLLRKDKPIRPEDTPASLGISVLDIIDGGVIDVEFANEQGKGNNEENEDTCKIKIQMSQKESIMVNLQKNQPFKCIIHQCATQLNVPASKIKFYFDGDLIDLSDTPESLDFENEACIDLKLSA